jgi:hypothetical protein
MADDDEMSIASHGSARGRPSNFTRVTLLLQQQQEKKNSKDKQNAMHLLGVCNSMHGSGASEDQIRLYIESRRYGAEKCESLINGFNQCADECSNKYKELTCGHMVMTKVIICVTVTLFQVIFSFFSASEPP